MKSPPVRGFFYPNPPHVMSDSQLKHHFDGQCARRIAAMLQPLLPTFAGDDYAAAVDARVAPLELKARVQVLSEELHARLPDDYLTAVQLLTASLGEELREGQGMFNESWYLMPVAHYIETYGLAHPEQSLDAIEQITRRHTGEYAIRPYLRDWHELTMQRVTAWAQSPSHNVRRLASEGIRPRLPWATRYEPFIQNPEPVIRILDLLNNDPSPYVRTSVANNLNDISKDHPALALDTATRWLAECDSDATHWIIHKGLRSLIKAGHPEALALIGAAPDPAIRVSAIRLDNDRPRIGGHMTITATISNHSRQTRDILVDYHIHYRHADGSLHPAAYKMGRLRFGAGESATIQKRHPFRLIKTRRYHPGQHGLTIQANGNRSDLQPFDLKY